ncbi:MAG: membrane protein insertion efficiency factor YidD [Ruminococcaceae bacterium]|nr:membrane protein insertion efficiency factor YidD [Oscillospiraceae bacterium]
MKRIFIKLIEFYQLHISKNIKPRCRFYPTCSEYMKLAIEKYGVIKGIKKGIQRINRCEPPNGGVDFP